VEMAIAVGSCGPDARRAKRSMVIVEDEPLIAMMIGGMAADLGWDVAWIAHNEPAAFDLLGSNAPPSVAVLDIALGRTKSFVLAAACRDRDIPVLFITGYALTQVPDECGDSPVLAKPFSPDDFQTALVRCLDRKRRPETEPASRLQ
jgi:CheY-like chemotaxis protein